MNNIMNNILIIITKFNYLIVKQSNKYKSFNYLIFE